VVRVKKLRYHDVMHDCRWPALLIAPFLAFGCGGGSITLPDLGASTKDMSAGGGNTNEVSLTTTSTITSCLVVDTSAAYFTEDLPDGTDLAAAASTDMRGPQDAGVTSSGGAQVRRVAIADGTSTILADNSDSPGCVVADGTNVYYTSSDKVYAVAKAGGTPHIVLSGQHFISHLAIGNGYLYWVSDVLPGQNDLAAMYSIVRATTTGTNLAVVDSQVNGIPAALAADATNVYYSDESGTWGRPLSSPTATRIQYGLASDTVKDNNFAVDTVHIATVDVSAIGVGSVNVEKLDGTGQVQLSAKLAATLTVDSSGVYGKQNNDLVRFALDGSATVVVADRGPQAITLDAANVYFLDGSALWKIAKP
jgi:hypothetical protein